MFAKRRVYQIIALFITNSYFFTFFKCISPPVFNCYACPLAVFACPVGIFQNFIIIGKIPFYTFGILGITAIFIGRMTCAWVCPFGLIQEILYKIPVSKVNFPKFYKNFKWIFLIFLVILLPYFFKDTFFCKICPAGTLEAGIPLIVLKSNLRKMIGILFYFKIFILFLFIYLMIKTYRPFCRIVCPLGLFLSLFNKISFFRMTVEDGCNECRKCEKKCPMELNFYKEPNARECIRCLECKEECEYIKTGF